MKNIRLFIIASVAILAATACTDSFLDKKPLDKLSEEDVFSNPSMIENYVNHFYAILSDYYQEGNVACITDEGFFRYGGTSTNYIARGLMNPDNVMYGEEGGAAHNTRTTTLNIWNRAYEGIHNINDLITKFEENPELAPESARRQYLGESYFFRAWMYANLVQRYGGVPLIKKAYTPSDTMNAPRANFDDCINFILDDLAKAKELLPQKTDKKGRVDGDCCLALASRITLVAASPLFNDPGNPQGGITRGQYNSAKWDRALIASKAMIDRIDVDGAYSLATKYTDFWENEDSPEIIWAKYFTINAGKKAQLLYAPVRLNGWYSICATEAMVNDVPMANGKKIFEDGSGYDPQHPWAGRDPRFYKIFCEPMAKYADSTYNSMHYFKKTKTAGGDLVTSDNYTGAETADDDDGCGKFLWSKTYDSGIGLRKWVIESEPINESETVTKLYPWFRVAEMYLNYAEAAYFTGDESTCRQYINKVRARADVNMPAITDAGANLFDRLVNERRVELCFENGFRYFDLRRWKLAPFYENVAIYGQMTLAFPNGGTKGYAMKDNMGNNIKVIYRISKKYDPSAEQPAWYKLTGLVNPEHTLTYDYNGRHYEINKNIVTYSWLGQPYVVDYGECSNLGMSPNKNFPESNYLMPIPQNEITMSVGTIEQNPGY